MQEHWRKRKKGWQTADDMRAYQAARSWEERRLQRRLRGPKEAGSKSDIDSDKTKKRSDSKLVEVAR